jgi:uncharacterized protein YjdB
LSCGHDSPTTPATQRAALGVHATTLDSLTDGTIDVVVSYRRQGGQLVSVAAKPSSIPLGTGVTANQQVDVDLAACLADSQRAEAQQRGCPLVVELALRDASGLEIDRQQASLASRVMPGQVTDVPAVALANAGSVTIAAPASTQLHPGEKIQLTATVRMPNGSVNDKFPVKWSTSSAAVATVDEKTGEVTAIAPGAVTITAKAGVRTAQMALTVVVPVARVAISPDPVSMDWNTQDTSKVTVTVTAFDASGAPITDLADRSIVWASDDTTTATVAAIDQPGQARVTGVFMGKTTVSATVDGVRGTAPVSVAPTLGYMGGGTIAVGQTFQLEIEWATANSERISIPDADQWVSLNPAVATVTQTGLVTGVAVGTAVIQGTYRGFTASATLTVVSVAKVEVSIRMLTLEVGQTAQVTAVARDARGNALERVITWESEAPGLASVSSLVAPGVASVSSSAVVTGRALGITQIRAFAEGVNAAIDVTVVAPSVQTISVTPATLALNVGATGTLVATARDVNGNVMTSPVSWTTNNPAVATVSNDGIVTAVGAGRTTIAATGGLKTASATVTVGAPNAPIGVDLGFISSAPLTYTITIAWDDNSNNEDNFQVERAVGGTNNFALIATVPGSNNARGFSLDADNITEATLYSYRVRACNAVGCSAYAGPGTIPGPLREPTDLVAVRDGSGVRLTWQDNSAREDGYTVLVYRVDANEVVTPVSTHELPANTTEFVAPGGAPGTTVFYHVQEHANVAGFGSYSSVGPTSQRFTF